MMSDPEEAQKLTRMHKDLSRSKNLTVVENDIRTFEHSTNKHFNMEMNKQIRKQEKRRGTQVSLYESMVIEKKPKPDPIWWNKGFKESFKKAFANISNINASKPNALPSLTNDSHFRFQKRAVEILSPLSRSKFDITTHQFLKKDSSEVADGMKIGRK